MKAYAGSHGLCGEYGELWNAAEDKEQLMLMALSANGLQFLAESFANTWGLTTEYAVKTFGQYMNGQYLCKQNGYTTEMYCSFEGEITARATATLVVASNATIKTPRGRAVQIHLSGKNNVVIDCDGSCRLYVYGNDNTVKMTGRGRVKREDVVLPTDGTVKFLGERRKKI